MSGNQTDTPAGEIAQRAYTIAYGFHHEVVTLEHVLAALLREQQIINLLTKMKVDHEKISEGIDEFFRSGIIDTVSTGPAASSAFTTLFTKVVTQDRLTRSIGGFNDILYQLLLSDADDNHALTALRNAGVTTDKIDTFTRKGRREREDMGGAHPSPNVPTTLEEAQNYLKQYTTNLNDLVGEGKIDPLIGREDEVDRIVQIMARRTKNNAVLVGDPGVGKTAIAEGLAYKIVNKSAPETLHKAVVYSLNVADLIAGTRYRGDFEERMKMVLASLALIELPILFIDEIHTIMDAGSAGSKGSLDVANLLKPALAKGQLRCLGSTTLEEYRKHFEKDKALIRRFQKIQVDEPSIDEAILILKGLSPVYENFHSVAYESDAIEAAVRLTAKYVHTGKLPDKAIDALDSSGARRKISFDKADNVIRVSDIETEVAKIAKIPSSDISEDDSDKLARLDDDLKKKVFGQDPAVDALVDAVMDHRSGLRAVDKSAGAFLFVGPTGVGKTLVAQQLATTLGVKLIRFDMSEYMEKHSVSRLIGSPPGYVGYEDGNGGSGLLINAIDENPQCVLLLDEIEKAHPDISNIFLQVFDNGTLTSSTGKVVHFNNVIVIMTSNAGAYSSAKSVIGFGRTPELAGVDDKVINETFKPEFRNRLDAVIKFSALAEENVILIVDKMIGELVARAAERNVKINVSQEAKIWLAKNGFDVEYGARPLERIIKKEVRTPISKLMVTGPLKNGGTVNVDLEGEGITVNV